MGDLDDAIREHLELKRKHGASEDEVTIKEKEAQQSGALPSEAGAAPADEPSDMTPPALADPERLEIAGVSPTEPPPVTLPDELEPDEVLPEDALEVPPPEDLSAPEPGEVGGPAPDWSGRDSEEPQGDRSEDVLEETPEFLEDMPEQDRLWFEQRPPKDFDFDD